MDIVRSNINDDRTTLLLFKIHILYTRGNSYTTYFPASSPDTQQQHLVTYINESKNASFQGDATPRRLNHLRSTDI